MPELDSGPNHMNVSEKLQARLAALPTKPGVYLMRNNSNRVIYVGKAVVLRHRVRSYFQNSANHPPKTERMVRDIADLEWIITESELEALVLEAELIKRYRPHYNVRLKDDKRYPYIKITLQDDFPRVLIVRNMLQDGARYFGPFTSSQAVHQSLETIRRLFPYCTRDPEAARRKGRPCLYYHMGRCPGVCIGAISKEDYRAIIDRIILFLEGKQEHIVEGLRAEMQHKADALHFEDAAKLRNEIDALTRIIERQRVVSGHLHDHDFLAFARENGQACVQVFFVRGGKLIGREYFVLTGTSDESDSEVMRSFLTQFYEEAAHIPPEILVQSGLDGIGVIQEWLHRKRGSKVLIKVPKRGDKRQVMQLATENAIETLNRLRDEWEADASKQVEALTELQQALGLPEPPSRIECYDISNTQGTNATGSMVVFVNGAPSKQDYRRFRIRTVEGPDDYASMAEVLRRRFDRARSRDRQGAATTEAETEKPGASTDSERGPITGRNRKDDRWAIMPDLVIVDGGKGQLSAARKVMEEQGVSDIPTAGLAEQHEELFVPDQSRPVVLPRDSQALYLLQRIRDEAHRFALTYHRKLRDKAGVSSVLEEVPGIGPRRRRALLKEFGSLEAIRNASVDELATVQGMNRRAAEQLLEYL